MSSRFNFIVQLYFRINLFKVDKYNGKITNGSLGSKTEREEPKNRGQKESEGAWKRSKVSKSIAKEGRK